METHYSTKEQTMENKSINNNGNPLAAAMGYLFVGRLGSIKILKVILKGGRIFYHLFVYRWKYLLNTIKYFVI